MSERDRSFSEALYRPELTFYNTFSLSLHYSIPSALEYLHNISKDLETEISEKFFTKREQNGVNRSSSPTPRKASGRGKGRGKRKAPDYDSDQNDDADFDPGDQIEVESEEDEDEDEDFADLVSFRQKNKVRMHKNDYLPVI